MRKALPVLAFTPGDPLGVGPEIAVRAARDAQVRRVCRPVLFGPRAVFHAAGWRPGRAALIDVGDAGGLRRRAPTARGGRVSYEIFVRALGLSRRGVIAGMVTGPVSKEAWKMAGVRAADQTALIQAETRAPKVGMMLLGSGLRAVLATRHIPLSRVPGAIDKAALCEAVHLAASALRKGLGVPRPRLGLCALNPHAGEKGLIGKEEVERIGPIAVGLRRTGLAVYGPLPADAAWAAHRQGCYDALIALYHDQAMVPLKVAAGYGIVNWTIGAPVVRTAPGHGTAYDIAGRGKADASGMIAAALHAAKISSRLNGL